MCELARNSVLQSGFELMLKQHWLGNSLADVQKTNVPLVRLKFRQDTLEEEIAMVHRYTRNRSISERVIIQQSNSDGYSNSNPNLHHIKLKSELRAFPGAGLLIERNRRRTASMWSDTNEVALQ
jgi:hypothetical protein